MNEKNKGVLLIIAVLSFVVYPCNGQPADNSTVVIGSQFWSTKNLDVATFRNGDPIGEAKTADEWQAAGEKGEPKWCYYENDPSNNLKYGKLYNWYALADARGICPTGWHVPTDLEWTALTDYLGGLPVSGAKMKNTIGWEENGNGNNKSGFSGLPGGRHTSNGPFLDAGWYGYWWSSTEGDTRHTSDRDLHYAWGRDLHYEDGLVRRYDFLKEDGMSVRCLRD